MPDLKGIEYILFAGIGAIIGIVICAVILFPLSFLFPAVWDAAVWVLAACVAGGLIFATQID